METIPGVKSSLGFFGHKLLHNLKLVAFVMVLRRMPLMKWCCCCTCCCCRCCCGCSVYYYPYYYYYYHNPYHYGWLVHPSL